MNRGAGERGAAADLAFAAVTSIAVVTAAFLPVLAGRRSFFSYDLMYEHLPVWTWVDSTLRSGHSPFWIDALASGHPLLFTQEIPLFYPVTLPVLLLSSSVSRAADLFSLLHFLLAGVAAFLLARELAGGRGPALLASIAWMLCARNVQSVAWPGAVAVAALVPAILLGLVRMAAGRASGVAWTGTALGLALLACRPQSVLGALPAILAFTTGALLVARDRRHFAGSAALALVLGASLGAPGVLPAILYHPEMDRFGGLTPSARDEGSLRIHELSLLALPAADPARSIETAAYPGLVTVSLLVFGIFLPERRNSAGRIWFTCLAAGGLAGILLALGSAGPYRWISEVPVLRAFRAPGRFLLSYSVAAAFGAALVLGRLCRLWRGSRSGSLVAGAAVVCLAVDLVPNARRAVPTVPASLIAVRPALAEYLSRVPPDPLGFPRRYWSAGLLAPLHTLPDELALAAMAQDHLNNAAGLRFQLSTVQGAGPLVSLTARLFEQPRVPAARIAGAARVVLRSPLPGFPLASPGAPRLSQAAVYAVPDPLPRAILVGKIIRAPPEETLAVILSPGFDPEHTVVVEEGGPLAASPAWKSTAGTITTRRREPSHVEFDVLLPADGALVLFDAFASGWQATIDRRTVPLLIADSCFRAVRVAAGSHRVGFDYSPPGLLPALALSVLGALGIVLSGRRRGPP